MIVLFGDLCKFICCRDCILEGFFFWMVLVLISIVSDLKKVVVVILLDKILMDVIVFNVILD